MNTLSILCIISFATANRHPYWRINRRALKKDEEEAKIQEGKLTKANETKQQSEILLTRVQTLQMEIENAARDFNSQITHYENENTRFVHLFDGGTADNLGFTPLLELLNSFFPTDSDQKSTSEWKQETKHVGIIAVDARSANPENYEARAVPPNIVNTIFTTVGTAIDSKSFRLSKELERITDQLETDKVISKKFVVNVSFENITKFHIHTDSHIHAHIHVEPSSQSHNHKHAGRGHDHLNQHTTINVPDLENCRLKFERIPTNWNLSDDEIDGLIAMGEALVRDSKAYQDLIEAIDGELPSSKDTVATVCANYQKVLTSEK